MGDDAHAVVSAASGTLARERSIKEIRAEIESSQNQRVLDTPRTREACKRLGLVLEDLQFRTWDSFYIPGDIKEKHALRFEHSEKKRKEKLAQVLAERAKVMALAAKKGEVPGAQSGQFLSMLETLFEKEAKRLETDLKSQLRQHSALVNQNEDQLKKEEQFLAKHALRGQRCDGAVMKAKERGQMTRDKREKSAAHNQELMKTLNDEHREKQVAHTRALVAEQERMERFRGEQAGTNDEKTRKWKEKVARFQQKGKDLVEQRRLDGEEKFLELEAKIVAVHERRESEMQRRQLVGEEQHLHMMDVRANRDRIDRVNGFRRQELGEQIDTNVERIETLLALKDQLLDQRRARTLKAEATKGSRGINLQKDCAPGPGQYEAPPSCMTEFPVPKIAQSKTGHSEFIDAVTRVTAANPPPGHYDTHMLKNGDNVETTQAAAAKFGGRDRDSFLDEAMKAKESIPAPGRYEVKSTMDSRATKMAREKITDIGLDKHAPKRFPIWARPATETPGPTGYSIDDYTRKEVLRRAQKSLPNLTRDMLRAPRPTDKA